jgi:hypothetical protein
VRAAPPARVPAHSADQALPRLCRVSADGHRHHRGSAARGVDARRTAAGGHHPHVWCHCCRCVCCADNVIIGLLTLATRRSQETASAAIYTAFSRTSTQPCRPTLPPTTSKRFAKSLTCVARCTRAFLRCLTCAHRCQDRTNDATSGRQKQPVYVTRVDVVQKQTLWNYQVRCSFGRKGTSDHRVSCACSVRKAGLS